MNQKDKENLAASIFGAHQELENVFICENGIAFRTEKEAKDYSKPKNLKYEEFERGEVLENVVNYEKEVAKKEVDEKKTAQKDSANQRGKSTKK